MTHYSNVKDDALPDSVASKELIERGRKQANEADRLRQRGAEATKHMVLDCVLGNTISKDDAIVIIDYFPTAASEVTTCAKQLELARASGEETSIKQKMIGIAFVTTAKEQECLDAMHRHTVYESWFTGRIALPSIGRIGAKQLPADERPTPPNAPKLQIGYIAPDTQNDSKPYLVLPDAIAERFKASQPIAQQWDTFALAHIKKYGKPPARLYGKLREETGVPIVVDDVIKISLPAAREDDQHVVALHDPENIKDSIDDVLISFQMYTEKKVKVVVTEALEIWFDGAGLDCDTKVLSKLTTPVLAFGCGKYDFSEDRERGIKFECANDLEYLTMVGSDGSKDTNTVCMLMATITNKTGKSMKLSYHDKTPMTDDVGTTMTNRWNLKVKKGVVFQPAIVDVGGRAAQNKPVGFADSGAVFVDKYGKLPSDNALIVFDCEIVNSEKDASQATIRPICPKLVLKADFTILKGKFVKLT